MSSVVIPYVNLQPDYAEVFDDVATARLPSETAWLSAYAVNAPQASIHAKLRLEPATEDEHAGGVNVSITGVPADKSQIEVRRVQGSQLDLDVESSGSSSIEGYTSARGVQSTLRVPRTRLRLPRRRFVSGITGPLGITAFDTTDSPQRRYVAGGADGQLLVGSLDGGSGETDQDHANSKVKLKGHVGDMRSARFFPSGEVILSTSSDMTARIFSAIDGSNPRTFKGHKRAVLDSAIIGRGREVLTCSADGTVRLWDVGADRQKTVLAAEAYSAVNALSLGSKNAQVEENEGQKQDTVAMGLSSGSVQLYDLRSRTPTLLIPPPPFPLGPPPAASDHWTQSHGKAVTALDRLPDQNLLLAGSSDGIVNLHDLRMVSGSSSASSSGSSTSSSLGSWRRNGAAVTDVAFLPPHPDKSTHFVSSAADGLVYRADISDMLQDDPTSTSQLRGPILLEEYVGFDVEGVDSVRLDTSLRVLLAGSGGVMFRY